MRARSISFKLFVFTSLALIGMITITMLVQLFFFAGYYEHQKSSAFKRRFLEIADDLKRTNPAAAAIPDAFAPFESQYYALAAIGTIRDGRIVLSLGKGELAQDGAVREQPAAPDSKPDGGLDDLPKKLLNTALPNPEVADLARSLNTWMHDADAYATVMTDGQPFFRRADSVYGDPGRSKLLVAVAPLNAANGEGTFMIAAASLQPVGDAVAVFRSFYLYLYALGIVLILLLVALYSKMITKPLRLLNRVALKMARLDFSETSPIRRRDEIGNLSNTLHFLADNLRQSLSDLQTANAELQTANAKLQADMDKERQLERLRREFVAGVSHELKTPISLISGFAEGLIDNVRQGKKKERYARIILEEASRMAELVKDMLDLAQLESGQYRLKPETFALDELIRSVARKHEPLLADKRIELALCPAVVHADRLRVEQVAANLLSNAARHAAGGGRIRISMRETGNGAVETSVWNEGEPLPESLQALIWEPFYKAEHVRETDEPSGAGPLQGSGLGLSIVKQILRLHGSDFGVRNAENGVRFAFTLKLANVDS